jgi:hypothetical protein
MFPWVDLIGLFPYLYTFYLFIFIFPPGVFSRFSSVSFSPAGKKFKQQQQLLPCHAQSPSHWLESQTVTCAVTVPCWTNLLLARVIQIVTTVVAMPCCSATFLLASNSNSNNLLLCHTRLSCSCAMLRGHFSIG